MRIDNVADGRSVRPATTIAAIAAVVVIFGIVGFFRVERSREITSEPTDSPMQVPLWVPADQVEYDDGIAHNFDSPDVLAPLREREALDMVVDGAATDEEIALRLMHWARSQFEPGRPDPYPPPNATHILDEIRADRTGGFCAQYCFVFMQAAGSLGVPVRMVTISGHELTEVWTSEQQRWILFDPMYTLQVLDENGTPLSALDTRDRFREGGAVSLSTDQTYPGSAEEYFQRFDRLAIWGRNDFVSRPLNFPDFRYCRIWVEPIPEAGIPSGSLSSPGPELYIPPADSLGGH